MKEFTFTEKKYNASDAKHTERDLLELVNVNNVIGLIKLYRSVTGEGLKESKDAIDSCKVPTTTSQLYSPSGASSYQYKLDSKKVVKLFKYVTNWKPDPTPLSKEQYMKIISDALDQKGTLYFKDFIEINQLLINNIKKYGGLEKIAEDYDKFIEAL